MIRVKSTELAEWFIWMFDISPGGEIPGGAWKIAGERREKKMGVALSKGLYCLINKDQTQCGI